MNNFIFCLVSARIICHREVTNYDENNVCLMSMREYCKTLIDEKVKAS